MTKDQTAEDAPAAIHERISAAVREGFHILPFAELRFEGDMPNLGYADQTSEHPAELCILTCLIEHDAHWHLYVITLCRPDFNTHSHDLTDRVLSMLASAAMEDRATVEAVGHG